MSAKSKIAWTQATWNPVVGCTPVSPGCAHCYAARVASRRLKNVPAYRGLARDGHWTGEVRLLPDRLDQPLRWKRGRMIFVCSTSDLFHESVPIEYILRVLRVIERCPQHIFQVLTKRPERAVDVFGGSSGAGLSVPALPNLWFGATVEELQYLDHRLTLALHVPAAVHFLSAEPLLGPLDIRFTCGPRGCDVPADEYGNAMGPCGYYCDPSESGGHHDHRSLDWVIVGCESGPQRRPMPLDWARSLRDQCRAAGVPLFVKQLDLDGRVSRDMAEWPEDLRIREWPKGYPPPTEAVE